MSLSTRLFLFHAILRYRSFHINPGRVARMTPWWLADQGTCFGIRRRRTKRGRMSKTLSLVMSSHNILLRKERISRPLGDRLCRTRSKEEQSISTLVISKCWESGKRRTVLFGFWMGSWSKTCTVHKWVNLWIYYWVHVQG